ncbi:MAG: serine hydroxymethyltransferase [Candidatus Colwellbacteria bacterium]|nr:serine hydroxymethyltransferase [Candidatus Colwellbacteria bacterium]
MDPILKRILDAETKRQQETLDLIASENMASAETRGVLASLLANKYSEGYPGKRYYPGNVNVDNVEELAKKRALQLFGLEGTGWCVNVQPYSGSPANLAVYLALVKPGGLLMGMKLSDGGHLTHGHPVSATGKIWESVQYGVDADTGLINYSEVAKLAKKYKPELIISGFTAYPRKIDFKKFRAIADSVGAYHMTDISHVAGLIAGGVYPSPFTWADVITTTTHKTLRGPRGAVIFSDRHSKTAKARGVDLPHLIDRAVFPGLQGGPHANVIAAKAQAFYEALRPDFRIYARQIVKNAKALESALKKRGFRLVGGGTDSHLLLVDLKNFGIDGLTAENLLEGSAIIANRNSIPGDTSPLKPSGIRLGTPSLTSRGMKEKDMALVAELIYKVIAERKVVRQEVLKLCKKYPAKQLLKTL